VCNPTPTQTHKTLACAINIAEDSTSHGKFRYSLKLGTSHSTGESSLRWHRGGQRKRHPPLLGCPVPQDQCGRPFPLLPLHPSHSPAGESSLPSCRRSCHTSLPHPAGLNAVRWVTPVPACGRQEHHQGLILRGRRRPTPPPDSGTSRSLPACCPAMLTPNFFTCGPASFTHSFSPGSHPQKG